MAGYGYRVLCIEDDAETRILLKKGLQNAGMEVTAVWNGEKGLEAARSGEFDCVLLDLMMPGMDGFEVIRKLRENEATRALPIVVVSARAEPEIQQKASQLGTDLYVTKPFSIKQLAEQVRQLIAAAAERA